jgi:hypothetical protein
LAVGGLLLLRLRKKRFFKLASIDGGGRQFCVTQRSRVAWRLSRWVDSMLRRDRRQGHQEALATVSISRKGLVKVAQVKWRTKISAGENLTPGIKVPVNVCAQKE